MRIAITGSLGLIGWHLRCRLLHGPHDVISGGRDVFQSDAALDAFVEGADAIVHLAGANRGDDSDVEATNVGLAEALAASIRRSGKGPHVLFSNSILCHAETPYGRSKSRAAKILEEWAGEAGAPFTNLILPHVFGECGRPFYNSVVATFCYQLANGICPTIHEDGRIELLHAQAVATTIERAIVNRTEGDLRLPGASMTVSELHAILTSLAKSYNDLLIPPLNDLIVLDLFNTFRSFLFPGRYPVELQLRADERGDLLEGVRTIHGGQAFVSTTRPGITRGNHFHFHKFERFLVLRGEGVVRIRRLLHDNVEVFRLSGSSPSFVDIPTLHTHNITNVGDDELLTMFWSSEIFDPERPDTVPEVV